MSVQIVIEKWEGGREWVQMSILPTSVWLIIYKRSVQYFVLLEVSASAPYVCNCLKYEALLQLWGPAVVRTWECHFCEEVTIIDQKLIEVQEHSSRPALVGLQHCKCLAIERSSYAPCLNGSTWRLRHRNVRMIEKKSLLRGLCVCGVANSQNFILIWSICTMVHGFGRKCCESHKCYC